MGVLKAAARAGGRHLSVDDYRRAFGSVVDTSPKARAERADRLFPVKAYRALRERPQDGYPSAQWFSDTPAVVNTYARDQGSVIVPARLNLGNYLDVDANGAVYHMIPVSRVPFHVQTSHPGMTSTNLIVNAARERGYDSVRWRNIRDGYSMVDNFGDEQVPLSTVYAVLKPHLVRSRFAMFDPERTDVAEWLAGLAVGAPLVGGGTLAALHRREQA